MNKKPFWRRVNRGFVVSMALLAAALIYVVVTQLMLIPEREKIAKLTDEFRGLVESVSKLDRQKISSLQDDEKMQNELKDLKNKLSRLFAKDSGYIDEAAGYLAGIMQRQVENIEYITERSAAKEVERTFLIDQDVANTSARFLYMVSGEYNNLAEGKTEKIENGQRQLYLTINFKKTDKDWKIFRVSSAMWENLGGNYDMYGKPPVGVR